MSIVPLIWLSRPMPSIPPLKPMRWSIFCRVIDNYGDAGVCLRLARELAHRGQLIDFFIDNQEILSWMEPEIHPNIKVRVWSSKEEEEDWLLKNQGFYVGENDLIADVIVEAFGCEIPAAFKELISNQSKRGQQTTQWINLEYLSAEGYAQRNHGLMSPILSGPGEGSHKWFFYPGFTKLTGGLLIENKIREKINTSIPDTQISSPFKIGLFCYANAPLVQLLTDLRKHCEHSERKIVINISKGNQGDVQKFMSELIMTELQISKDSSETSLSLCLLDSLTQNDFDEMLWNNDLNFVRGEDSLIRAIWAGKPWIWQIYNQSNGAHFTKLNAFLDLMECPLFIKEIHWGWNLFGDYNFALPSSKDARKWADWSAWCLQIRSKLLEQEDLVTQLMKFVDEKRQKTVEY